MKHDIATVRHAPNFTTREKTIVANSYDAVRARAESTSIRTIMGNTPFTVHPDSNLEEIADLFLFRGVSSASLVDREGRPYAMVRLEDVLRVLFESQSLDAQRGVAENAAEIATPWVLSLRENASISMAAALMAEHRVQRVPILDGAGKITGTIGSAEIVKWVADHAQ